MTPRRFFTTGGEPFQYTRLDPRAGVACDRGNFVAAEDDDDVPALPVGTFETVRALCNDGEHLMTAGQFREAFDKFVAAFDLLPEPRTQWNAAGWILVALGENAIRAGSFQAAAGPLVDAMWAPGTIGNPWVHLRLGQVRYELGELDAAADELTRAYMGGGREIFEGLDEKYFALLEKVLLPPPGMDRLP